MSHTLKTTIVVPCFNEQHRLQPKAFLEFAESQPSIGLLFVNDGSDDDTRTILQSMTNANPSQCRMLTLTVNQGKAEAIRRGFLDVFASRADYCGFWDADLATPLTTICDFVDFLEKNTHVDILMAARVKLLGSEITRNPLRHYLGRVFATCVSVVLGLPVYDTQCGAKMFRVNERIKSIFSEPFLSRWIFDVELLQRFLRETSISTNGHAFPIQEYPIQKWTDIEGSKLKSSDFVRAAFELFRLWRLR